MEVVDQKKFTVTALDFEEKLFVIYDVLLKVKNIDIYLSKKAKIVFFLEKKP